MRHDEKRHYPLICECGYQAKDARDLQEHFDTTASLDDDDEEEES